MSTEVKEQFKTFVENHIKNPFVEEKLFTNYKELGEYDYIFLTVETDNIKYLFEYECYHTTEDGFNSYDFKLYGKQSA